MGRAHVALALLFWTWGGCPSSCDDRTGAAPVTGECPAPLLRDEGGGVVVLRGANFSADAKWREDRLPSQGRDELMLLRDALGMNAIRLLVFWEALEPLPAVYDQAYLDAIRAFVTMAGELSLHVVVDMHQDVFGRGFGHAGAPWWACEAEQYDTYEEQEPWFLGYLQPEVGHCFERLYRDGPTRWALVAAWSVLARELADLDAVYAYDLLNEPFWGLTSASEFERDVLPDFYVELIDAVRVADPDPFIMVEPAPPSNVGVRSELAHLGRERVLFGPHFYPAEVELGQQYQGDREGLHEHLRAFCADAARLKAPLVIGELGVRRNVKGLLPYLRDAYAELDAARLGAFYWSADRSGPSGYGLLTKEGELAVQAEGVATPYPSRTAGTPTRWSWNRDEAELVFHWNEDGTATGDTIITLPRLAFPQEVEVLLDEGHPYAVVGQRLRIPALGGSRTVTVRARPDGWAARARDAGVGTVLDAATPDARLDGGADRGPDDRGTPGATRPIEQTER